MKACRCHWRVSREPGEPRHRVMTAPLPEYEVNAGRFTIYIDVSRSIEV